MRSIIDGLEYMRIYWSAFGQNCLGVVFSVKSKTSLGVVLKMLGLTCVQYIYVILDCTHPSLSVIKIGFYCKCLVKGFLSKN